jgi:predicted XRE-type DNA-binding protein
MAHKFSELRAGMSPQTQARSGVRAQAMLAEMPLNELRQARGLSQKMLAEVLHVQQPSIAKMEKRTDMYLSTLRSHIEAMGGQLEVVARFPEGLVKISNFCDIDSVAAACALWACFIKVKPDALIPHGFHVTLHK